MHLSSNQHRSLRRLMTISFVLILLMSGVAWYHINKNIESSQIELAKSNNKIAAALIGDLIVNSLMLNSKSGTLRERALAGLNKRSVEEILKSNRYTNMRLISHYYLNAFEFQKISLIFGSGRILFSTNSDVIGQQVSSPQYFDKALRGESLSLHLHEGGGQKKKHSIVSFVPVYDKLKPANGNVAKKILQRKVIAVIELTVDKSLLTEHIRFTQTIVLIAWLTTLVLLIILFLYLMKYSSDLVSKYAKQIVTQSKSDSVTGLLNRHHFLRLLKASVIKTMQQNALSALLIIDIDHFRELNAKYDYSFGDEVLKILVQRINRLLGSEDTLARTGDDEFSILIEHPGSTASIQGFARRMLKKVNEPIQIDANYIHITCSIGISIVNQDAKEMEVLIQHADSALYNAKDFGRNNFQLFNRDNGRRHINFYERQYSLNKALEENEFVLFVQPKINGATGDIVGGEALIRWDNPDYGLVQPLEFLPALESSGLIHNVGKWVLNEACKICKHWQQQGLSGTTISVNVSTLQFKKEDFTMSVKEALASNELDGCMLELELTETCLMDNVEFSLNVLNTLKEMGVRIAIDDFGTGYSSFDYLNRFPIDELKIDRSFIKNVHDRSDNDHAAIVTAIMSLSHSLHLEVVAEGVETARELVYMNALGCKNVQGFLFSKPLPVNEFEALLKDNAPILQVLEDVRKKLT
ncbi:diguanylate cyclase/phosphodiesterase (GGDEF & EAL domains) with PAS/PAC sensor(s) [hydrothermal vent metagenome]|uniref:Diguanylate cyclase/phosphodiesterase (GGDEF & EAL domains) with PAS/PAC sensor(S) n=1 Tax=hydrothermal vent metagenome TaxID=652676 RepID=A0A3B0ZK03_9ZZZZ